MTRHLIAQKMGVICEFKIINNNVYLRVNNALVREAFYYALKGKSMKTPERHDQWDLFNIDNKTEEEVYEFLKKTLIDDAKFEVTKDE